MKEEDLLKAIGQVDDAFLQSCEDEWDSLRVTDNRAEDEAPDDRDAGDQDADDETHDDQDAEDDALDDQIREIDERAKNHKDNKSNKKIKVISWRHFAGLAACACLVLAIFALVPGRFFQTSENSDSARLYSSEEETTQADEDMQEATAQNGEEDQTESESQLYGTEQADQDGKQVEGEKEYTWTETGICLANITVEGENYHLMTAEEAESYGIKEDQLSNVTQSMCGQEVGQVETCPDEPALIGASVYGYSSQEDNRDICILKVEDSYWFYVKD